MPTATALIFGATYHIFNRGNNRENIFREPRNYEYFLRLYAHHVAPVAHTLAYCLMRNHFHLLVRVKEAHVLAESKTPKPSQAFANLFNAYTKSINKEFGRTGSLFEHPFHRLRVQTDAYCSRLIAYIHRNPQKHEFVEDFRDCPWSSYGALTSTGQTRLLRDDVLELFGGRDGFIQSHSSTPHVPWLDEHDFV